MNQFIDHHIVARKILFDFKNTPRHWVHGDPFATHIINVLNVAITPIEHWFCRLANKTLPYVTDPNLIADLKGFIAQEAAHANAHKGSDIYFKSHDIDTADFKKFVDWVFKNVLSDSPFGTNKFLKSHERLWLAYRMGMIAVWEHYFCSFGTWVLDAKGLEGSDPVMLDIIRWHGAEEVEHRTVAYDAYRALAGDGIKSYILRQASAATAFPIMVIGWLGVGYYLCMIDKSPEAQKIAQNKNPLSFVWKFHQASKLDRLPKIMSVFKSLKHWSSFSYHPEHDGDVAKALAYIANSPAHQLMSINSKLEKR
ncbi:metal-dependent hydrolase [Acinetobacter sp. NRRL B-65365]|uniref:metal-dependent hydrolase n=1 Tax=Acinetobacter sp. NRRL B-65365 TaxID=1785092 RepID=UPI0007A091C8|nr:metal-dependent hydrolase [Acinetobacter sp. NRRL B-65365]KYQ81085.1 metal-dependent hydrolase [Acinetobacter sp. NRRL B-65365]